jgi:hypothetical protein
MLPGKDIPPQEANPAPPRLRSLEEFDGSLAHRVYLSLKTAILSLAYRPGEVLRKPEICEALGVSRSPVAEAVARLSACMVPGFTVIGAESVAEELPSLQSVVRMAWPSVAFLGPREFTEYRLGGPVPKRLTPERAKALERLEGRQGTARSRVAHVQQPGSVWPCRSPPARRRQWATEQRVVRA